MKVFISVMLVLSSVISPGQVFAEAGVFSGLKDLSGNPAAISDYTGKGKWTAVIIWASDCYVCNVEAEQYIQFHEAFKDKYVRMLGISVDGKAKLDDARAFIKRHDVTYPNLIGEPAEVAAMYENISGGTWVGTPTILVYDPKGELQAAQPGAVPVELIQEFIKGKIAQSKSSQTEVNQSSTAKN